MSKSSFPFIVFLSFFILQLQGNLLQAKTVEVVVQGVNCDQVNEMHLFEFDGLGFEQIPVSYTHLTLPTKA